MIYRTLARATRQLNKLAHADPTTPRKIQVIDHPTRGWLYSIVERDA